MAAKSHSRLSSRARNFNCQLPASYISSSWPSVMARISLMGEMRDSRVVPPSATASNASRTAVRRRTAACKSCWMAGAEACSHSRRLRKRSAEITPAPERNASRPSQVRSESWLLVEGWAVLANCTASRPSRGADWGGTRWVAPGEELDFRMTIGGLGGFRLTGKRAYTS